MFQIGGLIGAAGHRGHAHVFDANARGEWPTEKDRSEEGQDLEARSAQHGDRW